MTTRVKVLILALFQTGTMLAWAGYHEQLWRIAPTFRIALRPTDPYDLLRGRYFILNPKDQGIDTEKPTEGAPLSAAALQAFLGTEDDYQGAAQIGFCPAGAIRRVCALARPDAPRPTLPAMLWASGEVRLWRNRQAGTAPIFTGLIDLKLDRFFIPDQAHLPAPDNATGWEIEVVHREGQPLLPKRLWFGGKPVEF